MRIYHVMKKWVVEMKLPKFFTVALEGILLVYFTLRPYYLPVSIA
jgi:hypothetical protein